MHQCVSCRDVACASWFNPSFYSTPPQSSHAKTAQGVNANPKAQTKVRIAYAVVRTGKNQSQRWYTKYFYLYFLQFSFTFNCHFLLLLLPTPLIFLLFKLFCLLLVKDVDNSDFLKVFHSNFTIQYLLFSTCSVLLYHVTLCYMGSCKCRRGLSDPWNIGFYCSHTVFLFFFLTLSCSMFPK